MLVHVLLWAITTTESLNKGRFLALGIKLPVPEQDLQVLDAEAFIVSRPAVEIINHIMIIISVLQNSILGPIHGRWLHGRVHVCDRLVVFSQAVHFLVVVVHFLLVVGYSATKTITRRSSGLAGVGRTQPSGKDCRTSSRRARRDIGG